MQEKIDELIKERKNLYDRINNINEEIRQIRLDEINLDIEGKFIKYKSMFGIEHYCYVTDVTSVESEGNTKFSYLIRGHGFCGEFTGYGDATSFNWSYWHEFNIESNDIDFLKKQLENIEIITKEEFDKEFEEQVSNLIDYKTRYCYDN